MEPIVRSLTAKQRDVLDFIRKYQARHRISPTLEEMADHFGVSKITIYEHVKQLERKRYIRKSKHAARSIELLPGTAGWEREPTFPVLGVIAAGVPIETIEVPEMFRFSDMVPRGVDCYLLRVRGDSMIDEQIRDGDLVLVESRRNPSQGEIVVAVTPEGEVTLKKFYKESRRARKARGPASSDGWKRPRRGRVRLQPANSSMRPIYLDEVEIRGVVIGLLRSYR